MDDNKAIIALNDPDFMQDANMKKNVCQSVVLLALCALASSCGAVAAEASSFTIGRRLVRYCNQTTFSGEYISDVYILLSI